MPILYIQQSIKLISRYEFIYSSKLYLYYDVYFILVYYYYNIYLSYWMIDCGGTGRSGYGSITLKLHEVMDVSLCEWRLNTFNFHKYRKTKIYFLSFKIGHKDNKMLKILVSSEADVTQSVSGSSEISVLGSHRCVNVGPHLLQNVRNQLLTNQYLIFSWNDKNIFFLMISSCFTFCSHDEDVMLSTVLVIAIGFLSVGCSYTDIWLWLFT